MSNNNDSKKTITEIVEADKKQQQLNEIYIPKLSWAGKLFFASVGAYLANSAYKGYQNSQGMMGEDAMAPAPEGNEIKVPKLPIKIRATKEQIKAIMDAITSSVEFQEEISKPGATIESVIQKLNLKNTSKANFEQITGKKWPL